MVDYKALYQLLYSKLTQIHELIGLPSTDKEQTIRELIEQVQCDCEEIILELDSISDDEYEALNDEDIAAVEVLKNLIITNYNLHKHGIRIELDGKPVMLEFRIYDDTIQPEHDAFLLDF